MILFHSENPKAKIDLWKLGILEKKIPLPKLIFSFIKHVRKKIQIIAHLNSAIIYSL